MHFLSELTGEDGKALSQLQMDFIWDQAGGHLGLLESVSREIVQYTPEDLRGLSEQQSERSDSESRSTTI